MIFNPFRYFRTLRGYKRACNQWEHAYHRMHESLCDAQKVISDLRQTDELKQHEIENLKCDVNDLRNELKARGEQLEAVSKTLLEVDEKRALAVRQAASLADQFATVIDFAKSRRALALNVKVEKENKS